jgi:hypothetical protein
LVSLGDASDDDAVGARLLVLGLAHLVRIKVENLLLAKDGFPS